MKPIEALKEFFVNLTNKEILSFKRADPEGLRELCELSAEALNVDLVTTIEPNSVAFATAA
jgi:hypothetical protein